MAGPSSSSSTPFTLRTGESALDCDPRGVGSSESLSPSLESSVSSLAMELSLSLLELEVLSRLATEALGLSVESLFARILERIVPLKEREDSLVSDLLKDGYESSEGPESGPRYFDFPPPPFSLEVWFPILRCLQKCCSMCGVFSETRWDETELEVGEKGLR